MTVLVDSFRGEQFSHPLYSPDLAPKDFHLFLHLKIFLASQKFESDDDMKGNVLQWLKLQVAEFFEASTLRLLPRHNKCLNLHGAYVET